LFKQHGLDLQTMYPVKAEHNALQDAWTWDAFLKYAEMADKDGMTFGLGLGGGGNTDATDTHGASCPGDAADACRTLGVAHRAVRPQLQSMPSAGEGGRPGRWMLMHPVPRHSSHIPSVATGRTRPRRY
jgi:hypothetical protein